MATQFPEELDSFLNPQPTDSVAAVSHAAQHANANDAIEALQTKLGKDNSTDTTSIDFRVRALENATLDSEAVVDAVATSIVAGNGITKSYDDPADTITISVDTSIIATQTFATQAASDALTDANSYTDLAISGLSLVYDPIGSALNAETAAKNYADSLAVNYDPSGSAAAALIDANEYTDIAISSLGNQIGEDYVPISLLDQPDGVATLDSNGKVPLTQLNITEEIQDVAAAMITSATHTNISVSYDDNTGKLSFTASGGGSSLTQEEVQDFVAPLFNHAFHTNITATYDDVNNRITLQGNSGGGGASVIISPTAPSTPGLGDIWLDSDNGNTYIWDGAYWIEVGAGTAQAVAAVLSSPPANPVLGTIWLNTSTAKTYIYDGSFWAEI